MGNAFLVNIGRKHHVAHQDDHPDLTAACGSATHGALGTSHVLSIETCSHPDRPLLQHLQRHCWPWAFRSGTTNSGPQNPKICVEDGVNDSWQGQQSGSRRRVGRRAAVERDKGLPAPQSEVISPLEWAGLSTQHLVFHPAACYGAASLPCILRQPDGDAADCSVQTYQARVSK